MSFLKKSNKKNSELLNNASTDQGEWLKDDFEEGQLSVDVYQDEDHLYVKSTIAGVKPENIDIAINYDMLTIRGTREEQSVVSEESYLYKECYWGSFSRSIILPFDVRTEKIDATLENGILTIMLPKAKKNKQISIKVKEI
ncbi:MAG: Hsp20/alpha crystallin family protein [bacterium]